MFTKLLKKTYIMDNVFMVLWYRFKNQGNHKETWKAKSLFCDLIVLKRAVILTLDFGHDKIHVFNKEINFMKCIKTKSTNNYNPHKIYKQLYISLILQSLGQNIISLA